jgi:hypothetical protein
MFVVEEALCMLAKGVRWLRCSGEMTRWKRRPTKMVEGPLRKRSDEVVRWVFGVFSLMKQKESERGKPK